MRSRFAEGTDVPIERTRLELERLLSAYKARATAVFNSDKEAAVAFEMKDRRVLFRISMPDPKAREYTHSKPGKNNPARSLTPGAANARYEQGKMRRAREAAHRVRLQGRQNAAAAAGAELVNVKDLDAGDRVRLSKAAREAMCRVFTRQFNLDRTGTVVRVDRVRRLARIAWDGVSVRQTFAVEFLELAEDSE